MSEVGRLEIPADLAPWKVEGGPSEVVIADGGERRLSIASGARKTITIPGPHDPTSFTELRLEVTALDTALVSAHLVRETGDPAKPLATQNTPYVLLKGSPHKRSISLAFPQIRRQREPFDRLVLLVVREGRQVLHGGIALFDRPLATLTPPPGGAGGLIPVGDESRLGVGLLAGERVRAEVDLVPGSRLRFSFGMPVPTWVPEDQPFALKLTARGAGGEVLERRFELREAIEGERWSDEEVALDSLGNGRALFELECDAGDAEALCVVAEARVSAPANDPPTVLLVTSDTHRADHLGSSRSGVLVQTPVLDRLADEGVWFEDCWSSSNVTNPSHIALMTGTHPRDTGIHDNRTMLSGAAVTLAERFHAAGYRTFASLSARHLGNQTSGLGQGFDRLAFPHGDRDAEITIGYLERWLDGAIDEPVFVWLHLFDAHEPYEPPEPFRAEAFPTDRDPFEASPADPPAELSKITLPKSLTGLRDLNYPPAMYRGEVSYLDRELARLFDRDRFRAAVIAVTADHGESFGENGVFYDHVGLYPANLHVPLILRWPGAPAGTRVAAPVRQIDLGHTLLELASLEPGDFPGQSLLPAIERAPASPTPRFSLASDLVSASITSGDWHLILHLRDYHDPSSVRPFERHRVELYRLDRDPDCTEDLLERELERAKKMRASLLRWLGSARPAGWDGDVQQDEALLAHLAKLGYTATGESSSLDDVLEEDCDCAWCRRF